MKNSVQRAVLLMVLATGAACGGTTAPVPPASNPPPPAPPPPPPPAPVAGQLVVAWGEFSMGYAAAVVLEIRGARIGKISNPDARLFLHSEISADSMSAHVVLAGQIFTQDLAVFDVPDVGAITSYHPKLIAAAGPDGELYGLEGYALRIYKREP